MSSDAITEARDQAVVNEQAQCVASARNIGQLRDKLVDAKHARMGG